MDSRHFLPVVMILFALAQGATFGEVQQLSRAKFEVFGMMDEYMMVFGDTDPELIERFYPSEGPAAAHFMKLLPAYTAQEGISPDFTRKVDAEGFISFYSPAIAADIRRHYKQGALNESEFNGASSEDLLRFVDGVYIRDNYERAAIINAANSYDKVHSLAACLSKLGCKNVHCYKYEAVPTSNVLIFTPTESLRHKLGIEKDISFAELNKSFANSLKLDDKKGL